MNDVKEDSTFKSYIGESELEVSITLDDAQRTKILDGETIVYEAPKVLLYPPLSDRRKYIPGILTITTFKLSFASAEDVEPSNCFQQNLLLGINDVCLSSIDVIYQIGDRNKKKLTPGQNVTGKVKDILIVCKNMKSFEFSFKMCDKDSGKNVVNALLHHAYPKRHSLLFAYDYKEPYVNETLNREARFFLVKSDWEKELKRTKCQNWRISQANFNFHISPMMVETIIVPQSVTDTIIKAAVEKFCCRFLPIWVWGTSKGAALVRMADLLPAIMDRTEENKLLEHIRKSHPDKKPPHIIDLSSPTPKDIQVSFLKLRELCTPDNTRIFKSQDFKFYGLLDGTKWLSHVSTCLTKAMEAADKISMHGSTVVLQEGNGQDMNCIVSSLTQLILDPFFRTKFGFQSLVQKEWVALGHPFANRLGHILDKEIEPSPLFLLFLDCVWQLLQQYPTAFQISETYLTTLWDSTHISVFDTFLFNCTHARFMAETGSAHLHPPLILRSVWDWREQFSDRDIGLFCNPLFDDSFKEQLKPHTGLSGMDIWLQCYFRWLPDLEIRNGGHPQVDLISRYIVSEILQTQQGIADVNGRVNRNKEECMELIRKVNSFFPFSHISGPVSGDPINNVLLSGDTLDSQSILNFNNE
ncbi:myotubularin-related protein 10-A isoform X1 [Leptinotarsa decemlineata]|uniref:myotubularin-related protein 10-A isoform X1 n=1 Tax=Leptinotarsa decemlineata TaxID=7539 RepID=UPI003D307899